ncbi:MAG: UDP-N-acetylmuramyl-tripeptide synthetase, partial [Victivallaceae bacterium]
MKNLDFYVGILSEVILSIDNPGNPEIQQVTDDSRLVRQGDIFVAIPGVKLDGSKYINCAISQGACCIVYQSGLELTLPKNVCGLEVTNSRLALAWLQKASFDSPDEKLMMFGVTGTNGKTTSAYILRTILEQMHLPCGLISTVESICGAQHTPSECTTPDAKHLYGLLDDFVKADLKSCAMEISSHSLTQYRTGGIKFKSAIFTNLTGDHLDYHHDMEQYFAAKQRLFLEHLEPDSTAAINIDDTYGAKLAGILQGKKRCQVASFGSGLGAEYRIINMKNSATKSQFTIKYQNKCYDFTSNLIGRHNVYNLAGALVALASAKVATLEQLSTALNTLIIKVPGRLEKV